MGKVTIEDVDLKGKKVLLRVDFNVPQDEEGKITDDSRIRAALPTIDYILENGGKPILCSHLGRPKGKVVDSLRMDGVAERLGELLGKKVIKLDDCVGQNVEEAVAKMSPGEVILLENLRFHPEEEKNDEKFAKSLANLADLYVSDAFGTVHRAHASTEGVTKFLPSACGFLLRKEIEYFERALMNPERPFVAILGGAKVSDKIGVIQNLLGKVDYLLIGGGMAYTFLKSEGLGVGDSLLEEDKIELAKDLLDEKILLPVDHLVAKRKSQDAEKKVTPNAKIDDGWMGLDIGPKTIERFSEIIKRAKTIIWNGPLGYSEIKAFSEGTKKIANLLAESDALTIIGGGDTVAAVKKFNLTSKISHVSTGGGASLELLEGKELPGIAALTDK